MFVSAGLIMLLMSLDPGSWSPLSDCSRAGHLSPGRCFPSSESSFTSYFTLLLSTFCLAFEGRANAAARPASFTITALIQLEPFLSSRRVQMVQRFSASPESARLWRSNPGSSSFWTKDCSLLEADPGVAELRARTSGPGCGGVGGLSGFRLQPSPSGLVSRSASGH